MRQKKDAPLRSDAQRNRERILEVALEELTRSAGVPLSAIAKKAERYVALLLHGAAAMSAGT